MDNWDFFKENLATAYGSEGTLEEQADVYAQSWEAARDRVTAAAQDIYNSLINPDFFISIDNVLTPLLSGIARVADSFGGLKEIFISLLYMITSSKNVQDQLTQSVRNFAENLGLATGYYTEQLRLEQQKASRLAIELNLGRDLTANQQARNVLIEKGLALRQQINELEDSLTAKQRQLLDIHKSKLDILEKELTTEMEKSVEAEKQVSAAKEAILTTPNINSQQNLGKTISWLGQQQKVYPNLSSTNGQMFNSLSDTKAFSQSLTTLFTGFDETGKRVTSVYKNIQNLTGALEELIQKKTALDTFFKEIDRAGEVRIIDNTSVQQLKDWANEIGIADKNLENFMQKTINNTALSSTEKFNAILEQLRFKLRGVNTDIEITSGTLKRLGADSSNVENYKTALETLGKDQQQVMQMTRQHENLQEEFNQRLQNGTYTVTDLADTLVTVGRQLSAIAMGMRGLTNVAETLFDSDLTGGEKFIRILTSIGMLIPTITTLLKACNGQIGLNTLQTLAYGAANTFLGTSFQAGTAGVVTFGAALKAAFPLLGLISIAIAGVVAVVNEATAAEEEYQQSLRDTAYEEAKAAKEENDANQELLKTMKSAIETYEENVDTKEDLDTATRAVAEAFDVEGVALAQLTGKQSDYNAVLEEAIALQKEQLELELGKEENAKEAAGEEVVAAAVKGSGHRVIGSSNYEANTGTFQIEDIGDIIAQNITSDIGTTDLGYLQLSFDSDDVSNFVKAYDELVAARQQLDQEIDSNILQDDPVYEWLTTWIDKMEESVEAYRDYANNVLGLKLQVGSAEGQTITDTDVTNVKEYEDYLNQINEIINQSADASLDTDTVMDTIVGSSLNSDLANLQNAYNVISDIEDQLSTDSLIDHNFLIETFNYLTPEQVEAMASLDYSIIQTKESYMALGEAAINYADAVNTLTEEQTKLAQIESVIKDYDDGKLDKDSMTALAEDIDWGDQEKDIISFSEFLQKSASEQQKYLNSLLSKSYQQIVDSTTKSVGEMRKKIAEYNKIMDSLTEGDVGNVENALKVWGKVQKAVEDYQNQVEDFDISNYLDPGDWDSLFTGDHISFEDFLDLDPEIIQSTVEDGIGNAQATIDKVEVSQDAINQLETEINEQQLSVEVDIQTNFQNQLDQIRNSASDITTVFDAIAKGIEISTDSAGNSIWALSNDAMESIADIYPMFTETSQLLENGTWALTEEMYQAFFDADTGIIASDANTKIALLENQKTILEGKKQSFLDAIEIAEKLASGEVDIQKLEDDDKKVLLDSYETYNEIKNGEMLADTVDTLTTDRTNWGTLWQDVSDYADTGVTNMAASMSQSTESVLKNLEKIRSAAATAANQISAIGEGVDLGQEIDTTPYTFGGVLGTTEIDTSNKDAFITSVEDTVQNSQEYQDYMASLEGELAEDEQKRLSIASGKALLSLYNNGLELTQRQINAIEFAQADMVSSIDDAYDKAKKASDTYTKGSGSGSGSSKDQKQKDLTDDTDEEVEKYHEINRQLEYYDDLINKIDQDASNATTVGEKLDLEAQKVDLLNEKYEQLGEKRKQAYSYMNTDKADIENEFGSMFSVAGLNIDFDENGEITNYEDLEKYLIDAVQATIDLRNAWVTGVYNVATGDEQENLENTLKSYDNAVDDANDVLKKFRNAVSDYETDIDTYKDSINEIKDLIEELTEAERQRYELNLEKLQQLEEKFHTLEREASQLDFSRTILGNKVDINGTLTSLQELFGQDAQLIEEQALNAEKVYNQAWANIFTIREEIVENWPQVSFDEETGEIINYTEIIDGVRQAATNASAAVTAFEQNHDMDNLTSDEEEAYKGLLDIQIAANAAVDQFEKFGDEYESAIDECIDASKDFSDAMVDMLDNAEKAFDAIFEKLDELEDRLYRINRVIAWDDLADSILEDAYDLATSDAQRAEIVEQQISSLEERQKHLEQSIAVSQQNLADWQKELKEIYGAEFDENGEILTVQIQGETVSIEDSDRIYAYLHTLQDEYAQLTAIEEAERTAEQQARAAEIAKWLKLFEEAENYSNILDEIIDKETELSNIPVQIKEKEEDLAELQKKKNTEEIEDLETIDYRYHDINRELEQLETLLDNISTASDRAFGTARIKNYNDQLTSLNKQLDKLLDKLEENADYIQADYTKLTLYGTPEIDTTTGELLNYADLIGPSQQAYEDYYNNTYLPAVTALNARISAGADITDDEYSAYEDIANELEILKTAYENAADAIDQYDESVDTRLEIIEEWKDTIREIEDVKLEEITYELEVKIQIKNMKQAADEFSKQIVESFGDAITHGLASANWSSIMAQDEAALLTNYLEQYQDLKDYLANAIGFIDENGDYQYATDVSGAIDQLEDLQDKIISSGESLLDWVESLEDLVPDAIDAASERLAQFTDQLDHNNTVLSTIKELYTLQGVTYKTEEGYARLKKIAQEQYQAQLASAQITKEWFDGIAESLKDAEAKLEAATEGTTSYDILKANRDALLEEYNEAQEEYLEMAQEAMETAKQMCIDEIEKAKYEFDQAMSGGVGLDLLQDKFDNYIEEEERYLDTVNELYQVNSWQLKIQTAIDNASTTAQKERLKALLEELDARRQGNTLSEYDLDILEAKYNLTLAQIALEDIQDAKNQARLVRDSNGNWNYQFYADDAAIADARQEVLDAYNDWYNIAKDYSEECTQTILDNMAECRDKIAEIYEDDALTREEKAEAAAELYRHYGEMISYYESEKAQSISDMNQAGLNSIIDMTVNGTGSIIDMDGNSVPVIQQMTDSITGDLGDMADDSTLEFNTMTEDALELIQKLEQESGEEFDDMSKQIIACLSQLGIDENLIMSGIRTNGKGHITGLSSDIIAAMGGMLTVTANQNDNWYNDFGETLSDMTSSTDKFDETLDKYIDDCNASWDSYETNVGDVADGTETSVEKLDDDVNELADSTDILTEAGLNAADALYEQVSAAESASWAYQELANSIMETVYALEELSRAQAEVAANAYSGTGVGTGVVSVPGLDIDTSATIGTAVGVDDEGNLIDSNGNVVVSAGDFDIDWSALMASSVVYADTIEEGIAAAEQVAKLREQYTHGYTLGTDVLSNEEVMAAIISYRGALDTNSMDSMAGYEAVEWVQNAIEGGYTGSYQNNEKSWREWLEILGISSYGTGGYTGDFEDGKLALLHEKELVLNQQDTENILAAVSAIRSFDFSQVEKALDNNALNNMSSLSKAIGNAIVPETNTTIEQDVRIEASFPGVTSREEIEAAFNSLVNDAAQYARRRR